MRSAVRKTIIPFLALVPLISQWGCATAAKGPPPVLSEQDRAKLGTIGVVSARFAPEVQLEAPTGGKGSGALKGAGEGFVGSILGGVYAGIFTGGLGAVLGVALAPVMGMGGAVYGAIAAESAEKVEEAEITLTQAVGDLKIQEGLRDSVLRVAREQTHHVFVSLPEHGPTSPGEVVHYPSVTPRGIHTILEVSVAKLGLSGEGVNPPLPVVMSVRARLVRVADGEELYARDWAYTSGTRKFLEWADNDGQPFREELDRASQSLAEQIVRGIFLAPPAGTFTETGSAKPEMIVYPYFI